MLGTGNALATKCYNTCYILSHNNHHLLVDTGGGNTILKQLSLAGFSLNDIHDIFITHSHIDHFLGLFWIIRIAAQLMHHDNFSGNINIYSHDEVIALINDLIPKLLLPYQYNFLGKRIILHTLNNGDSVSLLESKFSVFDIASVRTKQFGFRINCNGRIIVCFGDEYPHSQCQHLALNADWVLLEAFCLDSQEHIFHPHEKYHSTVKDACLFAQKVSAKNVLLYHSNDNDITNRKINFLKEAKLYFSGNIFVPDDLERLQLL